MTISMDQIAIHVDVKAMELIDARHGNILLRTV